MYDPVADEFVKVTKGIPVEKPTEYKSRRNPLYDALVGAAEKLLQAVKGCEGRSNRDLKHVSFDRFFAIKSLAISFIALMGGVCYSTVLSFLGAYTSSIGVTGIGATCFFLCFAATSFISRPL